MSPKKAILNNNSEESERQRALSAVGEGWKEGDNMRNESTGLWVTAGKRSVI
jgi:hypothetical protein